MGILSVTKASSCYDRRSLASIPNLDGMVMLLGEGPMRFGPTGPERTIEEQLASLPVDGQACFEILRNKWHSRFQGQEAPDELILRFVRNSSGGEFNEKAAWRSLKRFNIRYLTLSVHTMEHQLLSKVSRFARLRCRHRTMPATT